MNDEQRKFKVYKYTLINDGRVYIGQTCDSLKERAGFNGYRYKGSKKFYHAIQKYGWQSFKSKIIKDNLTCEQANQLETKLINEYDSINKGFNLAFGGGNRVPTEQTRLKQSLAKRGQKNNRYGVKLSEQTKRKIGEANKKSQLGKKHSEQTKQKISLSHRKGIYVKCIETGQIYNGYIEAARAKGTQKSQGGHISECCRGLRKTAFNYHWEYSSEEAYNEWNQSLCKMVKK